MSHPLPPLDRRYKIEDVLGSGASASVFRAWDSVANRPVAIKCYTGSAQPSPWFCDNGSGAGPACHIPTSCGSWILAPATEAHLRS